MSGILGKCTIPLFYSKSFVPGVIAITAFRNSFEDPSPGNLRLQEKSPTIEHVVSGLSVHETQLLQTMLVLGKRAT
jgi:hypothetical protein